ncbi:MAG: rhodanese-like domain-containing protein [Verrucomicrobia bacterium]|nr:rhodanese-like domain-containing protein [Verrucomicrobiota bacterium]
MKWTAIRIIVAVVAILLLLKMAGRIPAKDALGYLNKGALVIDVRSSGEFNAGHLSTAINIPLDEIDTALPRRVKDKNQVLLLHCQSGMRSGVAVKKLKGMGYTNVFNLGSFSRAKEIVGTADGE